MRKSESNEKWETMSDNDQKKDKKKPVANLIHEVSHPALIPGIGVEDTPREFPTNKLVLAVAAIVTIGIVVWGIAAPDNLLGV